jgi:hypothetical protein
MGATRDAQRILVGKPEGKETTRKTYIRLEVNIKMDLRDIRWGGMDWTDLV